MLRAMPRFHDGLANSDEAARAYDAAFDAAFAELAEGRLEPFARHFAAHRQDPPRLAWDPPADSLPDPTLRQARVRWDAIRAGRRMPDWRDLHVESLGVDVVHLAIVDPLPGAHDFRFALYGSAISGMALRDYRGETVRGMGLRTGTPGPMFYRATYALCRTRGLPLVTWSAAPPWQPVEGWNRLVLPFTHDEGTGLRFLVCMKADGSRTVPDVVAREGMRRLRADSPAPPLPEAKPRV
jgi:hypothetical protein